MSATMNPGQVRVIDPILTNVARGYPRQEFAGMALFPEVPVDISGGQILEFGREEWRQYNLRRAPGATTKRISFGYAGKPYALVQDALEVPVPREHMRDAARQPGVQLGSIATNKGSRTLLLALEVEQATIARNPANYAAGNKTALGSGSRWSDSVDPTSTIETGREAIRAAIGVYPNIALLSAKAFKAARNSASIKDRFKYTTADSITTEMLARLWDIDRVVVGKSLTTNAADVTSDVWGTDAILAYTRIGAMDNAEPSYGYTYVMRGHPLVEQAYYEPGSKSWIYPVTYERVPVIAGAGGAYLMQTVTD